MPRVLRLATDGETRTFEYAANDLGLVTGERVELLPSGQVIATEKLLPVLRSFR